MTFSVSLAEWMEGQRVRAQTRPFAEKKFAVIPSLIAAGLIILSIVVRDWRILYSVAVWLLLAIGSCSLPQINAALFRLQYGGNQTPPQTVRFEQGGVFYSSTRGERRIKWKHLAEPREGETVWVFTDRLYGYLLFIIPKHALQLPDAQREWAMVEAHFAKPDALPIALPERNDQTVSLFPNAFFGSRSNWGGASLQATV